MITIRDFNRQLMKQYDTHHNIQIIKVETLEDFNQYETTKKLENLLYVNDMLLKYFYLYDFKNNIKYIISYSFIYNFNVENFIDVVRDCKDYVFI